MTDFDYIPCATNDDLLQQRGYLANRLSSEAGFIHNTSYALDLADRVKRIREVADELEAIGAEMLVRELRDAAERADVRAYGQQQEALNACGKSISAHVQATALHTPLVRDAKRLKDRLVQAYVLRVLAGARENANDSVTDKATDISEWSRIYRGTAASILCDMTEGQTPAALAWFAKRGIVG